MIKAFAEFMKNRRITTRIVTFYAILMVITLVVSTLIYTEISDSIIRRTMKESAIHNLDLIESNIQTSINSLNDYSKMLITHDELVNVLRMAEDGDVNVNDNSKLNEYLQNFMLHSPIDTVDIFDNQGKHYFVSHDGNVLLDSENYMDEEWFKEAYEAKGKYIIKNNIMTYLYSELEENYITLIRVINDTENQVPLGIALISVSEDYFYDSLEGNDSDMQLRIMDEDGSDVITSDFHQTFDFEKELKGTGGIEGAAKFLTVDNAGYLVVYGILEDYGWHIFNFIPVLESQQDANQFSYIAFFILLVNILIMLFGAAIMSRSIVHPINSLLESMEGIKKGEFVEVELDTGKNEMGDLKDGYNLMIREIQDLFNKVYEEQRSKRKAELNVLQAQIKPHFLYNTFDTISALTLTGRSDEAYKTIKALGSYYRTTLSNGKEIITLKEEVDATKNYLQIQKMRYDDVFEVEYDMDDSLMDMRILKLVLQPLVENAIYHGFKNHGLKGTIWIRAFKDDETVNISVEDNGAGIEPDKLDELLRSDWERKHFGLRGTIERLRIYYGKDDCIAIESEVGKGTNITITIDSESFLADSKNSNQ